MDFRQNAYCSYCGRPFKSNSWPRHCTHCQNYTYQNPTPVAVLLQPIKSAAGLGLLCVRRAIEPRKGQLALPGGYIDMGESWQTAAARELYEEATVEIDPAAVREFRVISVPNNVLIFGLAQTIAEETLPPFAPTSEASERVVLHKPTELAFPAHSAAMRDFFALLKSN